MNRITTFPWYTVIGCGRNADVVFKFLGEYCYVNHSFISGYFVKPKQYVSPFYNIPTAIMFIIDEYVDDMIRCLWNTMTRDITYLSLIGRITEDKCEYNYICTRRNQPLGDEQYQVASAILSITIDGSMKLDIPARPSFWCDLGKDSAPVSWRPN